MEVVDIDPDGDVVLICGREGEEKKGLRVCSRALARASPVFKALLSPCFKEGTELKTDGVVRVDLPEDAYEALRTVCLGLHFCHDQIKFDIPLKDLVDVARLADKYDLGRALRPVTELWITKHLEGVADTDYRMLLTAAYLLQHDRMFNKVGNSMVWDGFSDSFDAAFGEDCHDSSDLLALFGRLYEQRKKAIIATASAIEGIVIRDMDLRKKYGKYCKSGPNCSYVEKRVVWLLSHLRGLGLWPIHRLPGQGLDRILTALDNPSLNQPGMEDLDEGRACEGCKAYSQAPTLEALHLELSTKAADIEAGVKKVCYWCTREGSAWDQECGHEENKPDEASS